MSMKEDTDAYTVAALARRLIIAEEALRKLCDPVGHASPRGRDKWIRDTARDALQRIAASE